MLQLIVWNAIRISSNQGNKSSKKVFNYPVIKVSIVYLTIMYLSNADE